MEVLPKVSVAMATYNHEKFIEQAIESVLAQQTTFDYTLIVGDDCSQDKTQEIVRSYSDKYPEQIKTILYSKHIGLRSQDRVGLRVLEQCTGKYVALLDGDDYWISEHKLQRQVDLLEKHSGAAFCFHNTKVVFDDDPSQNYLSHPEPPADVKIDDIIQRWVAMTSSIVLRRDYLLPLPPWIIEINQADWLFQMLLAARGSVHYVDEVMSVYRRHSGGMSNMFADIDVSIDNTSRLYRHFNGWSEGKFREPVFRSLAALHFGSALRHRSLGRYIRFVHDAFLHLRFSRPTGLMGSMNSLRYFVVPRTWNAALSGTKAFKLCKEICGFQARGSRLL